MSAKPLTSDKLRGLYDDVAQFANDSGCSAMLPVIAALGRMALKQQRCIDLLLAASPELRRQLEQQQEAIDVINEAKHKGLDGPHIQISSVVACADIRRSTMCEYASR